MGTLEGGLAVIVEEEQSKNRFKDVAYLDDSEAADSQSLHIQPLSYHPGTLSVLSNRAAYDGHGRVVDFVAWVNYAEFSPREGWPPAHAMHLPLTPLLLLIAWPMKGYAAEVEIEATKVGQILPQVCELAAMANFFH